ncbi:MAG: NADH-quinone oxidoreductase subunit L [Rhodothermales bacterium]|nr:NADH-quinone oxidoreductase subunit L [Rhodothermales bacterium]MBO6780642.1 NADH-quinone oxidoreductase subunit L [Rhodothermales bacterium]
MDLDLAVRLMVLLPLVGAVLNGLLPLFVPSLRKNETLIAVIGTAAVAIPFVVALTLFIPMLGGHAEAGVSTLFTWLAAGDFSVDFAYRIDQLSILMTLIVTGVGSLIHLYSAGYMHDDPGYWRFFAYLNLFIFAMLNLVLGDNLLVLFLGWEGVGLCSYLLIGFWYTDLKNSAAANKAFIMNRVGDFAFLMAMFIFVREIGALDFATLLAEGPNMEQTMINWAVLLLFIGATGKSAQIPLFTWLPDAMAGPTPVSALIHAATMVTSGLYLLARMSPVVLEAPGMMAVVAVVGALTAIVAATIAITQNDIKKVLAYSTVSQLGFMFMASGVGAFFVAIFHVMTHAFFKGCLFLGSGSVIHGMHHVEHELEHDGHGHHLDPQDMRTMGGLKKYMPHTRRTFFVSTLAIAGIPLLSGFFSKDEILFKVFEAGFNGAPIAWLVWAVGVITALLTAIYMTRCYVLTFEGEPRWPHADTLHPHESPWQMTVPLYVLAVLSVGGGWVGFPAVFEAIGLESWIHHWLGANYGGPVAEAQYDGYVPAAIEWGLLGLGSLIGIGGVLLAWRWYTTEGLARDEKLAAQFGGLYRLWQGKYFVDEAYHRTVVRPVIGGAEKAFSPFDKYFVDGLVNLVGYTTRGFSYLLRYLQTGVVQSYAVALVFGVLLVLGLLLFG